MEVCLLVGAMSVFVFVRLLYYIYSMLCCNFDGFIDAAEFMTDIYFHIYIQIYSFKYFQTYLPEQPHKQPNINS